MNFRCSHWILIASIVGLMLFAAKGVIGQKLEPPGERKSVLIIHSYGSGYAWTTNVSEGIAAVFAANPQVQILREDMAALQIANPEYLINLYEIYKYKFRNTKLDTNICSDDNAFLFLKTHGRELFPEVPVVFYGVNYLDSTTLSAEDRKPSTGVLEDQDITATTEVAQSLHPYTKQKQIMVLNSYHQGMSWTDSIVDGVRSVLHDTSQFNLQIDYMDVKHNTNPEYIQKLFEVYRNKFSHRRFDAIVVSDDDAYNFMLKYHALLAPDTPVVFCGVNSPEDQAITRYPWSTGVVEAIDVRSTLRVAQKLHPQLQQVVVVNDQTTTGKANKKLLENIMSAFPELQFTFLEDMNMFEVQQYVTGLTTNTIVLLLTFNADKSNNTFSYEESADLITNASKVPVYAVWDFYLGHGVVGGMLTNGFSQGERAGQLVLEVLKGTPPSAIAVDNNSPNRYMFDYTMLEKYGISTGQLPEGSIIKHKPASFMEKNSDIILGGAFALSIIALLIQRNRSRKRLEYYATTDVLTGSMNRRTGLLFLRKQLALAQRTGKKLCICFVDINDFKKVNDQFGHHEGDNLIITIVNLLNQELREADALCRFGGDEFLLIHPNCTLDQAEAIWQRITRRLKAHNEHAADYKLGLSHGIAEYCPEKPLSTEDLLQVADGKMYLEKFEQHMR